MTDKIRPARETDRQLKAEIRALDRAGALPDKDVALSKRDALRRAGVTEPRELRRLADRLVAPARKSKAPAARKAGGKKSAAPVAAAPLLAAVPKKVGAVSKDAAAAKPSKHASYQPKTDVPPIDKAQKVRAVAAPGFFAPNLFAPDLLAMAQPWMTLGLHMTVAGLTMQARLARAAMSMPPAAMAMRQGTEAVNAWLALAGRAKPSRPAKD